VWFMPANVPPHKPNRPLALGQERLKMVELAIAGNPHFRVCDIELRIGGVSYSVDTVGRLIADYPDHSFVYIIGGDMVEYLPHWVRIDELAEMASFIGIGRPGYKAELSALPAHIASKVTMVEMPAIELSSTWIRSQLSAGRAVRYTVPEAVHAYVKERRIYES